MNDKQRIEIMLTTAQRAEDIERTCVQTLIAGCDDAPRTELIKTLHDLAQGWTLLRAEAAEIGEYGTVKARKWARRFIRRADGFFTRLETYGVENAASEQ